MIEKKLFKDVFKTTRKIVGDSIQVGDRIFTPTLEVIFYGKQISLDNKDSDPVFIGFIVKPISIQIAEGKKEWTILIQNN